MCEAFGYFMLHLFVISHEWNINAPQSSAGLKRQTRITDVSIATRVIFQTITKKKGTFVDPVFWFSPVLPGDTQTGCCAFPPPPHWRFLSPPTCNRMTSAAAPHTPRLHFWWGDCVLERPVGENMTRAPPAADTHPPTDSSSHLKRHYFCPFYVCALRCIKVLLCKYVLARVNKDAWWMQMSHRRMQMLTGVNLSAKCPRPRMKVLLFFHKQAKLGFVGGAGGIFLVPGNPGPRFQIALAGSWTLGGSTP